MQDGEQQTLFELPPIPLKEYVFPLTKAEKQKVARDAIECRLDFSPDNFPYKF